MSNGTHGGIIDWSDHHKLLDILDALSLLRASPDAAVATAWSATDEEQMVQWVSELSNWLKHSQHARAEARASNNHGTWFDVMALGLYVSAHGVHSARSFFGKRSNWNGTRLTDSWSSAPSRFKYLGALEDATRVCADALEKRIAKQVSGPRDGLPVGGMPLEDRRTNTQHYHSQNLAGMLTLAQLCRSINGTDLYHSKVQPTDSRSGKVSLLDAVEFVLPFVSNVTGEPKQPWPFKEAGEGEPYYWAQVLRKAANGYRNSTYEQAFAGTCADLIWLGLAQLAPSNSRAFL